MELHDTQLGAILFACSRRFSIITGGAGTGKTTIIKNIADKQSKTPLLCAFAGKAAARLREATGYDASTIHRLLGYRGDIFARESLNGETVIVDEASMVSSDLMAEIIKRNPARLILVGDEAQLPPVGKGQPFHDLIEICPESRFNLTICFRNSEAVFKAATTIRSGSMPLALDQSDSERWEIVKSGDPVATQRAILEMVNSGEIDFERDIILCPRNGESGDVPCTVKGLNRAIVDIVNPRESDDEKFLVGDRVINTKNFADHDVWNGTTGTIHSMNRNEIFVKLDIPVVDYEVIADDGKPVYKDIVCFDKEMKKSLQLAYALTVHRAQGSQYRRVIFCVLERDAFALLDRNLIYTAVTRVKEQCFVMGQIRALSQGISKTKAKTTVLQLLSKMGGYNA